KAAANTADSSRPQSFPVRIHQEDRGNSIWSLRIDGAAQVVEDFSEARTAGDHLQRSLLRDEKRFYCVAHGHLLTEHGPRGAPASTVRRAERLPEDGQVQICFLYPGLEWDQGHIRRPKGIESAGMPRVLADVIGAEGSHQRGSAVWSTARGVAMCGQRLGMCRSGDKRDTST